MSVWITRSAPDNLVTARRLRALGRAPLMVPLLETRPLPQDTVAVVPDALVFTSVHAVRHQAWTPALLPVPVYAASGHVAELAASSGYATVSSTWNDECALRELLDHVLRPRARVLMVCAERSSSELADHLRGRGHPVDRRVVYEPVPVSERTLDGVTHSLDRVDGVVVHSRGGAARLEPILRRTGWRGALWCISEQAAERLAGLDGVSIAVADRPTEASLLELISRAPSTARPTSRRRRRVDVEALLAPSRSRRRRGRLGADNDNVSGPDGPEDDPGPSAA